MSDESIESTSLEQAQTFHKSIEEHFSEVQDYRREDQTSENEKLAKKAIFHYSSKLE